VSSSFQVPDPLVLMREAFQFGHEALNLYYYDDSHVNKIEVNDYFISFPVFTVHCLPFSVLFIFLGCL
jgi:hypothetical protein